MRFGRRFMPILVASTSLSACRMYAPYEDCDNLGYATGDSFVVTLGEVLSVEQAAATLTCPLPEVGESFDVVVGARLEQEDGCYLPATGEQVPVFLRDMVYDCGAGWSNLAFRCGTPTGELLATLFGARAGESVDGKFSYSWPAPDFPCQVFVDVRIESTP